MKNLILIGFMGAGKTTAGKLLAKEKEMGFTDTDERIVSEQGREIPDIFARDAGQEAEPGAAQKPWVCRLPVRFQADDSGAGKE